MLKKCRNICIILVIVLLPSIQAASLDEMIGQMLIVGFEGFSINNNSPILEDIKNKRIGGVVLYNLDYQKYISEARKKNISLLDFGKMLKKDKDKRKSLDKNIKSPKQLRSLNKSLQENSLKYMQLPLIIAIDKEGGMVDRLSSNYGFPKSISQKTFATLSEKQARAVARDYSQVLKDNYINFVLAPVVDLAINPSNPVIARLDRAFSDDPKIVTRYSNYLINAYSKQYIACSIKHYPGHGSSKSDSHLGFVDVTETWSQKELEPFHNILLQNKNLVGLTVMTAHVVNKKLDDSGLPATLSNKMINILRENYNYRGIVVSDDLQMKAITEHFTLEDTLKLSIQAGNDILIFSNQLEYDDNIAKKAIAIIKKLIDKGDISEDRIITSYNKIIKLKAWISSDA